MKKKTIYEKLKEKYTDEEIADAFILPSELTPEEEQKELKEFQEFIKKLRKNMKKFETLKSIVNSKSSEYPLQHHNDAIFLEHKLVLELACEGYLHEVYHSDYTALQPTPKGLAACNYNSLEEYEASLPVTSGKKQFESINPFTFEKKTHEVDEFFYEVAHEVREALYNHFDNRVPSEKTADVHELMLNPYEPQFLVGVIKNRKDGETIAKKYKVTIEEVIEQP